METGKKNYRSLAIQIAVTITAFIVLIEGILLATSYIGKEKELHQLNIMLHESIEERYGYHITDALTQEYIDERLSSYAKNIMWLTLLIIACVVIGTMIVFYQIAGKHLYALIEFNRNFNPKSPKSFPVEQIPNNDMGELIHSYNEVIYRLSDSLVNNQIAEQQADAIATFSILNPDPVLRVDADGIIEVANPSANKNFGGSDLVGKKWDEIIQEQPFSEIEHVIRSGTQLQFETYFDSRTYVLRIVGIPDLNSMNVYSFDVSEQKRLQEQVFHSSKLASIGELAAGVGHEVNNPLAIIQAHLDRMIDGNPKYDYKESVPVLQKSIKRIADIVNGLRAFARLDDRLDTFDAHELIKECHALVNKIYEKQGVEINIDLNADSHYIHGIDGRFMQVMINLFANARDAVSEKSDGKISVSTRTEGDFLVIETIDNGCGISPANITKIFNSFFTTKSRTHGTGLGLGIVKSILKDMNGTISVKSELEKGSTFTIKLPHTSANVTKTTKTESAADLSFEKYDFKVLLVEDEPELQFVLKESMESIGLDVKVANNGREALDFLKVNHFDIIFSDITMPKMNGVELLENIRLGPYKNTPFVYITGGETPKVENAIPDAVILKPFMKSDLTEALSKLLISKTLSDAS